MTDPHPPQNARIHGVVAAVAAAATLIVFLELTRAMRSSLWLGFRAADVPPILAGWFGYAAIIAMATASLALAIPERFRSYHRLGTLPFAAAAAIWAALAGLAPDMGRGGTLAGWVVLGGAGIVLYGLTRKNSGLILPVAVMAVIAAVLGLIAGATVHRFLLFTPGVRPIAAWASLGVFGATWFLLVVSLRLKAPLQQAGATGVATLFFVSVGVAVVNLAAVRAATHDQPNLLFVTSDTLRADLCGVYGGPVPTPNMNRLAERAVLFDQSYALAPWTLPSMVGLLSSSYPPSPSPDRSIEKRKEEIGRYRFPDDTATLAELLAARGYRTAAFVANTLLDDSEGFLRGFDTSVVVGHRTHVQTGFFQPLPLLQQALRRPFPGLVRPRPVDTTRQLTTYATAFMGRTTQPWLIWIHYMDPHTAYDPPDTYRTEEGPWPVFCNADPYWGEREFDALGLVQLDPEHQGYVQSLYHGEIRYIDDALGQVLEQVERVRAGGRTFVCFTSDHGEEFWEHGNFGHGQSLHDELLRVPLMLAGPALPAQRVAEPFSAVHVIPTLAALLDLPAEPTWRGHEAATALLAGLAPEPMPVFAQGTHPSITAQPWQAVRLGPWKLLREMESGQTRLFNLDEDPGETCDRGGDLPAKAEQLTAILDEWASSFPAIFSSPEAVQPPTPHQDDLLQRLKHLGYL